MWWRPVRWRGTLSPLLNQQTTKSRPSVLKIALSPIPARSFTAGSLRYPEPSSKNQHNDVASYIAYAERTGLDVESKVYIGTHYEYSIAAALRLLGFDLKRVGGISDKGIDLLGTWRVPSVPEALPLRVLIQCKAYSTTKTTRVGPYLIRELEGAYLGAPPGWRGSGVLGMLVTQRPATKGVREALANSRWPLGYVSCSSDGMIEQMLWNQRAEDEGLQGMGVTVKMTDTARHGAEQHLVLTWKGVPYVPDVPEQVSADENPGTVVQETDATPEEKPKRKRRTRKALDTEAVQEETAEADATPDEKPKRKRRTKKVPDEETVAEIRDMESVAQEETAEADEKPKRKRRTKKVSDEEPVAEAPDAESVVQETAEADATPEEKPKRRRRTKRVSDEEPAVHEDTAEADEEPEKPKRTRRTRKVQEAEPVVSEEIAEADEKPKRRRRTKKVTDEEAIAVVVDG